MYTKKDFQRKTVSDSGISQEAQEVIDNADEDTILAVKLKAKGRITVTNAKAIEDRQDFVDAMRKQPEN